MSLRFHLVQTFYCLKLWRRHNQRVAFMIVLLFLSTFCVILPVLCRDWSYSKYHYLSFKSNTDYMSMAKSVNYNRIASAKHYLSQLDAETVLKRFTQMEQQKHQVTLAVGIVTVSRYHEGESLGYLSQVVTSFMNLFEHDKYFPNKVLFLCDGEPGNHAEAEMLGKYIPRYRRFTDDQHAEGDRYQKEKADYVFCLQKALTYKPKYVLIIEDDAVPRPELFMVLKHVLATVVERKYHGGDPIHNTQPWAYLKLYYPERWQGFSNELRTLAELLGVSLVGGLIFLYTCWFIEKRHTTHPAYYYLVGSIYTAIVVILVGRQYLIEVRRVSPSLYTVVSAPDCCSPAILYSANMANEMSTYLSEAKCTADFPIDFAMDKFAQTRHYQRYLVEPNLVKHIGLISSIKGAKKKAAEFLF